MTRRARLLLGLALAAAFAGRAAYCWRFPQWGPDRSIPNPDHYARLAQTLLDHGALLDEQGRPTAHREPLYPGFLAAVFAVSRTYRAVQLAQCAVGTLSVWLLFLWARRPFGERAALLAAWIAALYPGWVYYTNMLLRETLVTALLLAALIALARAGEEPGPGRFALAGAAGALLPLTSSAFLPWALGAAPVGIWWTQGRSRRAALLAAAYLAAAAPLYSTWVIRNFVQLGRFVAGATAGGGGSFYTYLIVPPELAGTPEQTAIAERDPVLRELAARNLSEFELDREQFKAGLALIRREPGLFARRVVGRFVKLWRFLPYKRDYPHGSGVIRLVSLASDGWIIPLALAGALLAGLARPELVQAHLMWLSTSAVYALIWAMVRYRMPMMAAAIPFAAFALVSAWERWWGQMLSLFSFFPKGRN